MISIVASLMLQGLAQADVRPPPPPPPPPPRARGEPARARANLGSLISNDDYPAEALRNEQEGTVGFRLHVGADGSVTGCDVTSSSGHASLDTATCRILTARARFTPARDRRGRATADTVSARIIWRIEEDSAPMGTRPMLLVATMRASPAGDVTCAIEINGLEIPPEPCPTSAPPGMIRAARQSGRTAEQSMVSIITPAGEVEPADREARGIQFLEAEAELNIAADGSVADCRTVRVEGRGPAAGRTDPPDPCKNFLSGNRLFGPAADEAPPRTVNVKLRGYMRN